MSSAVDTDSKSVKRVPLSYCRLRGQEKVVKCEYVTNNKRYGVPVQLGVQILAYSKVLVNRYIERIDGFHWPLILYSDTDSLFAFRDAFIRHSARIKNDYGKGEMMIGYFISPKLRMNVLLTGDNELLIEYCSKGVNLQKKFHKNNFWGDFAESERCFKELLDGGVFTSCEDLWLKNKKEDSVQQPVIIRPDSLIKMTKAVYRGKRRCDWMVDEPDLQKEDLDCKMMKSVISQRVAAYGFWEKEAL